MVTYRTLTSSIKLRGCFVTKMTRKSCVEQNILWQLQFSMLCRVLLNCSDRHARRCKAEIVAPLQAVVAEWAYHFSHIVLCLHFHVM